MRAADRTRSELDAGGPYASGRPFTVHPPKESIVSLTQSTCGGQEPTVPC